MSATGILPPPSNPPVPLSVQPALFGIMPRSCARSVVLLTVIGRDCQTVIIALNYSVGVRAERSVDALLQRDDRDVPGNLHLALFKVHVRLRLHP